MQESTISQKPEDSLPQAHFSNVIETLATRLGQSQYQVICCVDSACPPAWFKLLLACRRRGLEVTLIVPAIDLNIHSGLAWERLVAMGGQLVWLEVGNTSIHTSACVIDQNIVISGNFDDVKSVDEPVFSGIFIQNQPQAVAACLEGLNRLVQATAITADRPTDTLKAASPSPEANKLIPSADPVALVTAWQLNLLAHQSIVLDQEIAAMHLKINAFDTQQDHAIGGLLQRFLDIKQQYLTKVYQQFGGEQDQAQAAQADYARFQFRENIQTRSPSAVSLDPQQQDDIKYLYRKLAMLCHPDRVQAQHQLQAQELFQRVQDSYRNFDFPALKIIEQQLQKVPVDGRSTAPGSFASLVQRLADLQEKLSSQYASRQLILQNPTWRTLITQSNWDLWFSQQADYLQAEVQRYSQALEVNAQLAP
jgi:hypothetical protein